MRELDVAWNGVRSSAAFVFAHVLRKNATVERCRLDGNPLGEPGGRAIFRSILGGLKCFVSMRDCTFDAELGAVDVSRPSARPYVLDMARPYDEAVASALYDVAARKGRARDGERRRRRRGARRGAARRRRGRRLYEGGDAAKPWSLPERRAHADVPPAARRAGRGGRRRAARTLDVFLSILLDARSNIDRKNWLHIMSRDCFFTTAQAQHLIDTVREHSRSGSEFDVKDMMLQLWTRLVDEQVCVRLSLSLSLQLLRIRI